MVTSEPQVLHASISLDTLMRPMATWTQLTHGGEHDVLQRDVPPDVHVVSGFKQL